MKHSHEAMLKHRTHPHQNPPVEQFLKLSQAYQAHAFCVPGHLLFCFCAVAPTQPEANKVYYPLLLQLCCFGALSVRQACGPDHAADV